MIIPAGGNLMKRSFFVFLMLITTALFFVQIVPAQFPKLPKISIPKPKPAETPVPPSSTDSEAGSETKSVTTGSISSSGGPYAAVPEPPMNPLFLADALEIGIEHWDYYWKIPNDNHNTSWMPRINAKLFYGGSAKQRFKAEYTMPDGSPWFSEALEFRGSFNTRDAIASVVSESDSNRDKKAIIVGGLFGIKITNIKDNSTVFQGKFKVVRYKPKYSDARYKNEVDYYVDYDWKLPIGFADLYFERNAATPIIRMWFKGDLKNDNLEARLFRNGQQIATTDDGGLVDSGERFYADKRGDDESLFWREVKFSWPYRAEFIVTEDLRNFTAYKDTKFINQMPGEYMVKVYYNGEQVRETKFSIGTNGTYADNGIAKQNNLSTNKIILPIKVMGTVDKWNPANAKTMGFFGNPVVGIP
jgi:hypothetical protein